MPSRYNPWPDEDPEHHRSAGSEPAAPSRKDVWLALILAAVMGAVLLTLRYLRTVGP